MERRKWPPDCQMNVCSHSKSALCRHPVFHLCRQVLNKTNTLAGTPEYLAPEMIDYPHEHDLAVDWWALGVMVYAARLPAVGSNGKGSGWQTLLQAHGTRKPAASLASSESS